MPLRRAVTAEPIPSHVSALDYVIGPVLLDLWDVVAARFGTGCEAIVSAGRLARDLTSPGPRVRVVAHAPQPALLCRADLSVTHGGRASPLDAVQGATPILGLRVLADQPENVAAFARRGLGRALAPLTLTERPGRGAPGSAGRGRGDG
ncbi:hypothetical protein [Streptomyces sp. G45]|uniref:hypothetical protein n=1 Tax=Streptomyces sp. G45 TaxID=3406627 RepID=UPI003C1EF324